MSLLEAQIVTPNSFVRVNSAGELVSDILVSSIASTSYVDAAIAALINLAPSSLDTLSEIATELNLKQYKILSGYTIGSAVAIANTDNVEQAFGKVQASINTNAASIATNAAAIVTINSTLGTVVYLGSSQSVTGIKSFTQVIKADGGLDVTATGGSDVLNIGTSNADVINIGWSGAQVVIQGSVFSNNVTNLEITDKLIRLNKGGTTASASSTGFEIEENAIVTGYFATNGTRDGYDFKAPGITDYVTFSLAALTAHRTLTAPDADGIIATQSYSVAKAGDTMTGPLYVNYSGNSSAIAGNSISVYHTSANRYLTLVADATTSIRYIDLASGFSTYLNFAGSLSATNNISVPIGSGTLALTSDLYAYELSLGNPGTNGYVLSSTTAGVRSWVAVPSSITGTAASLLSLVLTGTAGAGYLQLLSQSSPPSAVAGNIIVYSNSSNSFSLVKRNAANSADITRTLSFPDSSVIYTYPGASDTLAGLGTAQTFSADQTFSGRLFGADGSQIAPTYSFTNGNTSGMYWNSGSSRLTFSVSNSPTFVLSNTEVIIGAAANTFRVVNATGSNVAGSSLTIAPGAGTGNTIATSLIFQTPTVGSSGSTVQLLTTRATIDVNGITINSGNFVGTLVGGYQQNATQANSHFAVAPGSGGNTNSQAQLQYNSANTQVRAFMRGSSTLTPTAGLNVVALNVGSMDATIASTGTHYLFAQVGIRAGTITSGAGALTNSATLYIDGAATGATNNYSLWVAAGKTKIDGSFGFGVAPATVQTGAINTAGATYTANEQDMLQKAYNALRTFGFLA